MNLRLRRAAYAGLAGAVACVAIGSGIVHAQYYPGAGYGYGAPRYAYAPYGYGRYGPADPCARTAGNRALGWGVVGMVAGGFAGAAVAAAGVAAEGAALGAFVGGVTGAVAGSASAACGTAGYAYYPQRPRYYPGYQGYYSQPAAYYPPQNSSYTVRRTYLYADRSCCVGTVYYREGYAAPPPQPTPYDQQGYGY